MSQTQLFALTYKAIFSMNYEIKSMRIPDDDSYSYGTSSDGSIKFSKWNFEACKALLKKRYIPVKKEKLCFGRAFFLYSKKIY